MNVDHSITDIIVYNCRSSGEWKDDMALSVTFSHGDRSTKAVLYGCTETVRKDMTDRLERCNYIVHHPLAIPVLFCDVERNRHFHLLDPVIRKFLNKAVNISKPQVLASPSAEHNCSNTTASSPESRPNEDSEDLMTSWLQVSDLKRGMETWKQQLQNLISHCEGLGTSQLGQANEDSENLDARQFKDAGKRIKERLVELKCEYDEKIRQCADIIDGMVLVAQLVRGCCCSLPPFSSSSP